jgi:OmpA-OmpF porin, OOP family
VKKLNTKTRIVTAVAAGIASVAQVPAVLADSVSVTPGVGYYSFDSDLKYDDTSAPSLGLQYQFGNKFAVEANYSESEVDFENSATDFDWRYVRLDAFYRYTGVSDKIIPYLVVGAGDAKSELNSGESDNETLLNAGAGVQFLLDKGLSIVADLRGINSIDAEKTSGLASLGLSYTMGFGQSKSSKGSFDISKNDSSDADSDHDGIANSADQCNDTPAGVAIDSNGCGLDGDNDGIADYRDECAQTPADIEVDNVGCPNDLDRDGIADYQDQCPESATGALIDKSGCAVQVSQNIQFQLNSAELPENSIGKVEEIATFLKRYDQTIAIIEGHSDSSGEQQYNEKLSNLRAAQVKQILVSQFGIDPKRIKTEAYGESKPIASNDTPEGRILNRRVTATVTAH